MRARAKQKYVAKATALGARVPQAELLVPIIGKNRSGGAKSSVSRQVDT